MEHKNTLPEPFATAFEKGASIDYMVEPKYDKGTDHEYVRKLGYEPKMRADCSCFADGLTCFNLSSYGDWGTFFTEWANDKEKDMFLDMYEKGIIKLWRIREYIGRYSYNYSVGDHWTRYMDTRETEEMCDCPYNIEK